MTVYEPTEFSAEARRANNRLRAALGRTDRDFALAKLLVKAAQSPVPDIGPGVQVSVRHAAGHPTGTDWWDVSRVGSQVRVVLADTAGPATPTGAMFPLFVRAVVAQFLDHTPGKLLAAVNRGTDRPRFRRPARGRDDGAATRCRDGPIRHRPGRDPPAGAGPRVRSARGNFLARPPPRRIRCSRVHGAFGRNAARRETGSDDRWNSDVH